MSATVPETQSSCTYISPQNIVQIASTLPRELLRSQNDGVIRSTRIGDTEDLGEALTRLSQMSGEIALNPALDHGADDLDVGMGKVVMQILSAD